MDIQSELIHHYPWLPSLKELYTDLASKDPSEFLLEIYSSGNGEKIQKRILELFRASSENLEQISEYKIDNLNIYLYLILKILLFVFNNKALTNQIANLYSKINYYELIKENEYNLYYICQDLKVEVQYNKIPWIYGINLVKDKKQQLKTNFRIHYASYLKLATFIQDDYRKLVNNNLSEGYVYIQSRSLARLIQEQVRQKFLSLESKNEDKVNDLRKKLLQIKEFKELYDIIFNMWELSKEDFEYTSELKFKEGANTSQDFPPCIKEILSKALESQNLTHIERLFLVFFLHAIEYPQDKIVDIFSVLPDFDRDKTLYQVDFAKKKGYTPHSCSTLKSLNLCMAAKYKDELCLNGYYSKKNEEQKKFSHPLFYVQLKQYRSSIKKNNVKNQDKNKNEQ